MENFKERFNALIIDKLEIDESVIISTARFSEDFGADSLDMVELIMEFEKEFNISVPDDDADKIKTVEDAQNYILKLISEKNN